MNEHTFTPGLSLRSLSVVFKTLKSLLIIATALVGVFTVLAIAGIGTVTQNVVIDPPYTVELVDGQSVSVDADGTLGFSGIGRNPEWGNFDLGRVRITTQTRVEGPGKAVSYVMVLTWLLVGWVAVRNLGLIIEEAKGGRPFASDTPKRMRQVGMALAIVPVIQLLGAAILDRTLERTFPFSVESQPSWELILVALGVFALAELFSEASRLREFEEATI